MMNIPGYKLVREISSGPLTSVYLCRQLSLDRDVLLKVLHPHHAADEEIVNRFVREAKLYAQLHHPNIVEVYDTGKKNGYFYIAMHYVPGWPLDQFIRTFKPIPLDIALLIMKNVLKGLQFAHTSGIIHRDIKPSNILIGHDSSIKLTDFGLAKPLNLPAITAQGTAIGTPAYMPPEVAKGQPADQTGDIFSAGATFYELLSGFSPFMSESIGESIHKVLNTNPESLRQHRDDIPKWCDKLILNMLEKNPKRRKESCAGILKTLQSGVTESALQFAPANFADNLVESGTIAEKEPVSEKPASDRRLTSKQIVFAVIAFISISLILFYSIQSNTGRVPGITATQNDTLITKPEPEGKIVESDRSEPEYNRPVQTTNQIAATVTGAENGDNTEIKNVSVSERSGFLYVAAIPWAEIYIDGEKKETTPLSKAIVLEPGNHVIALRNPNYQDYSQNVEIRPGITDSLMVQLESLMGSLQINVIPWGEIYLDDKYIDTTPLKAPVQINAGVYQLTVKNPNFGTFQQEIEIRSGMTEQIDVNLQR